MQIAKWGNSLAVRLPAELVRKLNLREGDQIELVPGEAGLAVSRQPRPQEVLDELRRFRGRLAPEDRLSRDAAHER
ncbi:AbrB/MazE/SpoVT family DNA-binding domain-containing protein [Salipiger sp. 1_MG-2023]|uniref:AbrB/MazE/SpoVT family DNA-binding domain-containing protein n=1 Tax=Salipiger sp. 1_MG-2023 TaxID=3062665 RepID=UPI0026E3D970|nr:AbrB/MazE/SpoVT family DNA-binding domain-containing protein [Salipiger sp. 1_MG-2023]MDO6587214.1 AbrB/MazE/SpoVT family DNA-binding domain-containing protein [Salipiger sp. 1_MG-2023]